MHKRGERVGEEQSRQSEWCPSPSVDEGECNAGEMLPSGDVRDGY